MKRTRLLTVVLAVAGFVIGSAGLAGEDSENNLRTRLTGFQEVIPILSNGTGVFTASVNSTSLTYTLTFSGLSSAAIASHIHFGQKGVNGSVFVFLCGGPTTPVCPAGGGTVTGTITGAD